MKKYLLLSLLAVALASCSQSPKSPAMQRSIQFSSNIRNYTTRMTNNSFDASDAIGIYMTGAATKDNAKYVTAGGGATASFAPADASNGVVFPQTGAVSFTAYYPYASLTDGQLPIDVKNAAQDVLWSNNLTNITGKEDMAGKSLQFRHMLSKVTMTLTGSTNGIQLKSVTLKNVATKSSLDVKAGTLAAASATDQVAMNVSGMSATAILVPSNNTGVELIVVTSDNKSYSYTFAQPLNLASGNLYSYRMKISAGGEVVLDEVNGSITDWLEADGGEIVLTPDEDPGTPGGGDPVQPQSTLLFSGSDFEDWDAFTAGLMYNLKHAEQATGAGRNGSGALHINSSDAKKNDYVLTAKSTGADFTGKKFISMYIKGTAEKNISMNVYKADGGYVPFNLDTDEDKGATISPEESPITLQPAVQNSYAKRGINTQGQWIQVKLDITGLDLAQSGSIFALKISKASTFDLYIDDITIE